MPKVTEQYREARRDEITGAALHCFAAKGFKGTSMADIIAESGLSAGAIYGHFEGKHDIMMAVAAQVISNRLEDLRSLSADGEVPSPAAVVTRMMTGMAGDAAHPSLLLQVWGQSMIEEGVREMLWGVFADIRAAYETYFTEWAERHDGLDPAAARAWAVGLVPVAIGLAQGYIVQTALFENFDAEAYLSSVRGLLPH